jgi:polysaccharide pyruvyl transferase WcaK-like protein
MSWLDRLKDALPERVRDAVEPALDRAADALDPDVALQLAMAAHIESAAARWPDIPWARWRRGEPLRLLFAGYSGTRNTGADVRVEEMLRQFRHVLGDELDLTILTHDPALSRGYFRTAKQLRMPRVFPRFLHDTIVDQHGVVACEGSMFKSKFATSLSTFMVGALGLAAAGGKLAVAYGGEAGAMTPGLERLVRRYVKDALVISRNEASRDILEGLGIPTLVGTDTAWTFEPAPDAVGREILRGLGWDGERPVLAVCPIHPYWWPVRPDLVKAAARFAVGAFEDDWYGSVYFHHGGPEVERRWARYLDAMAWAVRRFARAHDAFAVCVGTEQLDRGACERLAARLDGAPVLASDTTPMWELVSVLRQARWMVSSRYHGIVTSMPAGVLSVGVTMDERIRNLMEDRGTPELALGVDDPDLAPRLLAALERVEEDAAAIRDGLGATVVRNLGRMGRMGVWLATHVGDRLPGFPLPDGMGRRGDPWHHLPALSPALRDLVAHHPEAR